MTELTLCQRIGTQIDYLTFLKNCHAAAYECGRRGMRAGDPCEPRWVKVLSRLCDGERNISQLVESAILPYALAKTVFAGNEQDMERGLSAAEYCIDFAEAYLQCTDPSKNIDVRRCLAFACLLHDAVKPSEATPETLLHPSKNLIVKVFSQFYNPEVSGVLWELIEQCAVVRYTRRDEEFKTMENRVAQPLLNVVVDCANVSLLGESGIKWLLASNFSWRQVIVRFYRTLVHIPSSMKTEYFKRAKGPEKLAEMTEIIEQQAADLIRRFPVGWTINGYNFTSAIHSEKILDKLLSYNQRLKHPDWYFGIEPCEFNEIEWLVDNWIDDKNTKHIVIE